MKEICEYARKMVKLNVINPHKHKYTEKIPTNTFTRIQTIIRIHTHIHTFTKHSKYATKTRNKYKIALRRSKK